MRTGRVVEIELPWPPSINSYWRRQGARYFISKKGQQFRSDTVYLCHKFKGMFCDNQRLAVIIHAYPPDKRRRDIDNILKGLLDSFEHAQIFGDDSQIDEIHIKRFHQLDNKVVVSIMEITD